MRGETMSRVVINVMLSKWGTTDQKLLTFFMKIINGCRELSLIDEFVMYFLTFYQEWNQYGQENKWEIKLTKLDDFFLLWMILHLNSLCTWSCWQTASHFLISKLNATGSRYINSHPWKSFYPSHAKIITHIASCGVTLGVRSPRYEFSSGSKS